jgi:hypothetical protein
MKTRTTHEYLVRLRDLILQERECAKALDMKGMTEAVRAKEEVLGVLSHLKIVDDDDRALAAQIRAENRRNAFLFKSTLDWIRGTMEFFGQKTVSSTYSPYGSKVSSQVNGRLLSGRV